MAKGLPNWEAELVDTSQEVAQALKEQLELGSRHVHGSSTLVG
jgi:hypothetical protein